MNFKTWKITDRSSSPITSGQTVRKMESRNRRSLTRIPTHLRIVVSPVSVTTKDTKDTKRKGTTIKRACVSFVLFVSFVVVNDDLSTRQRRFTGHQIEKDDLVYGAVRRPGNRYLLIAPRHSPGTLLLHNELMERGGLHERNLMSAFRVVLLLSEPPRELHEDSSRFSFPRSENWVRFGPAMAGPMFDPCGES